tara:strand:- start:419 stop:607 length:189 start_codon:yes stop_codon:yes gene_type:complete
MKNIILFGACDTLDSAIASKSKGWNLVSVGRTEFHSDFYISWYQCQNNQKDDLKKTIQEKLV